MPLPTGTRLGPYEIVSHIGTGGMGEVYKAKDSRLDRTVAIKVLPPGSAHSTDLRQRFEREAKAVSSLNHPHICILHDVGQQDDTDYLVMEYIEGESLSTRLEKGPLPTSELLRYASQIADALDKAHRQGLVHRDLKPGNIMITKGGAKLLDFGLAKLTTANAASAFNESMTKAALTGEGTLLGTLQYMSPEQLEGREADSRSDIFAFGCVLYEMATGRRAFEGKSQASLIASIMGKDPTPISSVSTVVPVGLDRIVSRCLAKDPDDRWQTARDLMHELQYLGSGVSQIGGTVPFAPRARSRERWAWLAAVTVLAAALGAEVYLQVSGGRPPQVVSAMLPAPEGTRYVTVNGGNLALSPDGQILAFVAVDSLETENLLWVRPLASSSARALPGTEGAYFPFWSPDSRFVGFFADGKLKKIQVAGGPPLTIAEARIARGGTWNDKGDIVYCPVNFDVLYRVPAAGGKPVPVTFRDSLHSGWTHRWPFFLPDGVHFLYLARTGAAGASIEDVICVGSLRDSTSRELMRASSNMAYANGYLLFIQEGTIMGQAFDPQTLALTGDPVPVAEGVSSVSTWSRGVFTVSQSGALVFQQGPVESGSSLVVHDRAGQPLDSIGELDPYRWFRYSPDNKKVAISIIDEVTGYDDLWIYESSRDLFTRFTFDSSQELTPVWSPDGSKIAYIQITADSVGVRVRGADGVGDQRLANYPTRSTMVRLDDWSPDGKLLVQARSDSGKPNNLWAMPLAEPEKAFALVTSEFNDAMGECSPDGRWIAYQSNESGEMEVYVTTFPTASKKWRISTQRGWRPRWRGDGREIYYIDELDDIVAVEVNGSGAEFVVGAPELLFRTRPLFQGTVFDVTSDGQRFLVNTVRPQLLNSTANLVLNWPEQLKQR